MTRPPGAADAMAEIVEYERRLADARRRYQALLATDDMTERVAFALFQRKVLAEDDWPAGDPVSQEDWWELQIDEERDEWRDLAAHIINIVKEETSDD